MKSFQSTVAASKRKLRNWLWSGAMFVIVFLLGCIFIAISEIFQCRIWISKHLRVSPRRGGRRSPRYSAKRRSKAKRTVIPGVRISTTKHEIPLCFGAAGSVHSSRRQKRAYWANEIHTFRPLIGTGNTRAHEVRDLWQAAPHHLLAIDRLLHDGRATAAISFWPMDADPAAARYCQARKLVRQTGGRYRRWHHAFTV